LYDPDATGAGNQPMYFDQWAGLYSLYFVDRSIVHVRLYNKSTTSPTMVTVVPWVSPTITTTWKDILEQSKCRAATAMTVYTGPADIQVEEKTQNMFGVVPYDIQFRAAVTSNPSSMWYWHIGVYDPAGGGLTANYTISVEILYHVKFSQRTQQAGS
jgi:hypothetical protein